MKKTLIILILGVIVLCWNFVFTSDNKIEFTDQAKVLQSLSHAAKYKKAIYEYWKENKTLPDAKAWEQAGKKVKSDLRKSLVERIEVGVDGPGVIAVHFINKETIKLAKDISGTKIPSDLQGESLLSIYSGKTPADWRKSHYFHYYEYPGGHSVRRHYAVVDGRYKLIHFYEEDVNEWEERLKLVRREIEVEVSWQSKGRIRSVKLNTLKLVPIT